MLTLRGAPAGLQELDLSSSGCEWVARALSAATQLSALDLHNCCAIRLSRASVQMLLRLPRLALLCLATHTESGSGPPLPPPAQRSALALLQRERTGLQVRWYMCCCGARDSEPVAA